MRVERIVISGARGPIGITFDVPPTAGQYLVKAPGSNPRKFLTASGTGADAALRTDLAAEDGVLNVAGAVATRNSIAKVAAMDPEAGTPYLALGGRSGLFRWLSGDQSVKVTSDPLQGLYIAPTFDPTGASGCWERDWDKMHCNVDWFGAVSGSDVDDEQRTANVQAFNAALSLAPKVIFTGGYYINDAVQISKPYTCLEGPGRDLAALVTNSPTAHILAVVGPENSYVERPTLRGFTLAREVNATTPASPDEDRSQGHGLHMVRASNPVVDQVNSANNLMDFYWKDILSGYANDLFSGMYSGGSGDRRYSWYVDGRYDGTPPPFNTFPSVNPVFRLHNLRQTNASGASQTFGLYVYGSRTDMEIDFVETAACHYAATLEGTGSNFWIGRLWLDQSKISGLRVLDSSPGSRTNIAKFYGTMGPGASGQPLALDGCHNVVMTHVEVASLLGNSDGKAGVYASGAVRCSMDITNFDHGIGVDLVNCYGCEVTCRSQKNSGANGIAAIRQTGGAGNKLAAACIAVSGTVRFEAGIAAAGTGLSTFDLSMVLASAVTNRLTVDGNPVITQGNVGNNVVIIPGAAFTA